MSVGCSWCLFLLVFDIVPSAYPHTNAHTHTGAHAHTRGRIHSAHMHTGAHTQLTQCTHTNTQLTHATPTCAHTHSSHMCTQTYNSNAAHIILSAHTDKWAYMHTHGANMAHTYTQVHTLSFHRAHTHMHMCTHSSHKHAHTQSFSKACHLFCTPALSDWSDESESMCSSVSSEDNLWDRASLSWWEWLASADVETTYRYYKTRSDCVMMIADS